MIDWINIKEQLPKNDEWVLLTNCERIWLGQLDSHFTKKFYCKCCLEEFEEITHWMPLPELP